MEHAEYIDSLQLALDDAATIVHNQQIIAGIHRDLNRNLSQPFEQDFIYQEHFGQFPSQPRRIIYKGVVIITRILHQTGARLSDISGVDLLYEIENDKFSLIQYKRVKNDSVKNDVEQMASLLNNCPDVCPNKSKRPIPVQWLPSKTFSFCGCWYAVMDQKEGKYLPACETESIFQGQKTKSAKFFQKGISRTAFLDLFSSCRIGALLRNPKDRSVREEYVEQALENNHAVLEVRQQGKWTEK